jgi:hypothetical protein
MSLYARLAALAVLLLALAGAIWKIHHMGVVAGRAEIQAAWDQDRAERAAATLAAEKTNARETLRRLEAQQETQRAQDKLLAQARADAARNAADADRLRDQSAEAARRWRDALGNSPTGEQCAAAGTAIVVQADVLGRVDRIAVDLADYADRARAAGLKCQQDYDALKPP